MTNKFVLEPESDFDFLKSAFPEVELKLYKAIVRDNSFISAFSCWIESEKMLERFWSRINSLIGTEYQTNLDDEFSSWNIYIVFFSSHKISNALKYTIENDTFFVRKIIFDNQADSLEKEQIPKCLDDHILGKDIKIDPILNPSVIVESKYTSITQNLLSANIPLGPTVKEKKSRKKWLDNAILLVDNATLEVDNDED